MDSGGRAIARASKCSYLMMYFMISLNLSSAVPTLVSDRPEIISGMMLYRALPFRASSVKKSLAKFEILLTSSTMQRAISEI